MKLSNIFKSRARKHGETLATTLEQYDPHKGALGTTTEVYITALVKAGAHTEVVNKDGMTPLMAAAYKGVNKAMLPLIDAGANIEARSTDRSMIPNLTPLMWAAYSGNTAGIGTLVAAGADVKAKGYQDNTALHFAARKNPEAVAALLDAGADINAVTDSGRTPLFDAVLNPENAKTVALLIERGASLDATDKWSNRTILDAATAHGGKDNPVAKLVREAIAKRDAPKIEPVPAPVAAPAVAPPKPAAP